MNFALVVADKTKQVILSTLETFIKDEVKFHETFPNFQGVSVIGRHPFAYVRSAELDGQEFPANIFPSISVAMVTEKSRQPNILGMKTEEGFMTQEVLDAYTSLADEFKITSSTVVDQIQANLDASIKMTYENYRQLFGGRIVFSIWSDNDDITDFLYFVTKTFMEVKREEVFVNNDWDEITWNADREGLYNFDFGRPLYGASLNLEGSKTNKHIIVTTENVQRYDDVQTPIKGINSETGTEYQ